MRYTKSFVCGIVFLLITAFTLPAQVEIDKEPHHRIVFENEALRMIEVNIDAGDTTLEHIHNYDFATVTIDNADTRTRDAGKDWGPLRVREIGHINVAEYTGHPASHEVRNTGTGHYRLIGVENLRKSGWQDSEKLSGSGIVPADETRAFRIYDVRGEAGKAAIDHKHLSPTIVDLVSGKVRMDGPKRLDHPGDWLLIPAGGHHTLNAEGAEPVHVVEIEVR